MNKEYAISKLRNNGGLKINEGQFMIKSPNNSIGYFKREESTAEFFTKDGFFITKEIDKNENGSFLIKRTLEEKAKTTQGEFIVFENIENGYLGDKIKNIFVTIKENSLVAYIFYDNELFTKKRNNFRNSK